MTSGVLVLAATPIGSSAQASQALRELLGNADLIAAEDTRVFRKLMLRLGLHSDAKVVSFFDGNEAARTPELLEALVDGKTVAVVSDAGMPGVSDPGFRLVRAAVDAGVRVTAVPGPSAVPTALAVSGLASDRFCFEGFLPRKPGERRRRLEALRDEPRTMVFFEAPHRLAAFLGDAAAALGGDRRGVVCRELTKPHEEIVRGTLEELTSWSKGEVRGEITVVIEGAQITELSEEEALELVRQRVDEGQKLSAAVAEVAAATGTNRRRLYAAALSAKEEK